MKLINREQALSHPFANDKYDHINANKDFIRGFESYKEWLENLPTIDLIRCGECKWAKKEGDEGEGNLTCACHIPRFIVPSDGFCYLGERRK